MLRFTYNLYAGVLTWARPYVAQLTNLDLLAPIPRTVSTVGLSVGVGWGILSLVGISAPTWFLILLVIHGAFVGWVWDGIVRSDDFQLGTRLE